MQAYVDLQVERGFGAVFPQGCFRLGAGSCNLLEQFAEIFGASEEQGQFLSYGLQFPAALPHLHIEMEVGPDGVPTCKLGGDPIDALLLLVNKCSVNTVEDNEDGRIVMVQILSVYGMMDPMMGG